MDELKHQLYLSDLRIKKYLRADEFEAVEREEYNRQLILKQMEAKEKAKSLVDRMERSKEMPYQYAKQCALITVDEILNEYWAHDTIRRDWWQEVKTEIELL